MGKRSVIAVLLSIGISGIGNAADRVRKPDSAGSAFPLNAESLGPERVWLLGPPVREGLERRLTGVAFWTLAADVYLSGAGDYVTTRRFRGQGIDEANPLLGSMADSPAGFAMVKLGGGTLINYIAYNLKKDGKRYWAVPQIAWIAMNIAVSLHNRGAVD